MRRSLAMALCLSMVFCMSLAGCAKQEEPTKVEPTKESTEKAPSEEQWATDKDATAEDVLKAAAEAVKKEGLKLDFQVNSDLDLTVSYHAPEQSGDEGTSLIAKLYGGILNTVFSEKDEIRLRTKPSVTGLCEVGKGTHARVSVDGNAADVLADVIRNIRKSMGSESDGDLAWLSGKIETEIYQEKDGRTYYLNPKTGEWNYSEPDDDHEEEEPAEEAAEITPEKIFKTYEWTVKPDCYLLQGELNVEDLSEDRDGILQQARQFSDIHTKMLLTFDAEKHLTNVDVKTQPYESDLSNTIAGLRAKLDVFEVHATLAYDAVKNFVIPEDVKSSAVESEGLDGLIGGDDSETDKSGKHPWTNDVYVIGNTVVEDNDIFSMEIRGMRFDEYLGDCDITTELINKTDKDIQLVMTGCYVNGLKMNSFLMEEIPAGESAAADLTLYASELELAGIQSISKIELNAYAEDREEYEIIFEKGFVFYPQGEEKAYEETVDLGEDHLIAETEDFALYYDHAEEGYFGWELNAFAENKSDRSLSISMEHLSINGEDQGEISWSDGFPAKRKGYMSMMTGVQEEVENYSGILNVYDYEISYETPIASYDFEVSIQNGTPSVKTTEREIVPGEEEE